MMRVMSLARRALYSTHILPSAPGSFTKILPGQCVVGFPYSQARIRVRSPCPGGIRRKSTYEGFRCEVEVEGRKAEYVKWQSGGGTVHSQAEVHSSVVVEHGAFVDSNAHVEANAHISAGCIVGPGVSVGESTILGYNVVLQNCSVGASCILHPGVCIGQDGFGFLENSSGEIVKKPQLLRVQIGNHVEIGANTCIDRGSWRDTTVGDHTKIDNLVQIGHNAVIGRGCMLCGQVGIAGSATLGDYVVIGGKAGVVDHISVTSRVRIAAKSGVMSNIDIPGDYAGFPAVPVGEWRKQMVTLRKMGRPVKKSPTEPAGGEKSTTEDH